MTRILVQRGSAGSSSSNPIRSSSSSSSSSIRAEAQVAVSQVPLAVKDEASEEEVLEQVAGDELLEYSGSSDSKEKSDDIPMETLQCAENESSNEEVGDSEKLGREVFVGPGEPMKGLSGLRILERQTSESEDSSGDSLPAASGSSHPPPPPVPPPRPSAANSNSRRIASGISNAVRIGSSRRASAWPVVSARTSPTASRPSSPRSHNENEGYNSADEQNPCFTSSYGDLERERQFEIDVRRVKGLEVKRMLEDGNCLFRAVADQVYGDSEVYDLVRQMCIDYMDSYFLESDLGLDNKLKWGIGLSENKKHYTLKGYGSLCRCFRRHRCKERERDHFSQFITEGFTSYCKRKRRDKVYGNNVEIQALSEMYNRPIHIYSYSTEPINIFHGSYNTDTPSVRLSYHHGNHYNSLVDPRRQTVGAGLGFSCLRGTNIDKDQVKAAIKAQQDQQIDNALLAEGRLYSDLELTEKEIERMVIEVSRAEYLADDIFKQQLGRREESSTSNAEPSSSGATGPSSTDRKMESGKEHGLQDSVLSSSMQMVLSMGFSYLQVIEAYSIFGDDVDSMVCYLLETGSSSRRKGKATEGRN